MTRPRVCTTAELPRHQRAALRRLLEVAFDGDFTDDDWEHGLGGWHALVAVHDGELVAHAAVVPRTMEVGDRRRHVGYVESVATAPRHQRAGHGARAMRAVAEVIAARFDMGLLSTGRHGFYEALGWERWQGPTFVLRDGVPHRTPDEDDALMALRLGSRDVALTDPVTCRARRGDDW